MRSARSAKPGSRYWSGWNFLAFWKKACLISCSVALSAHAQGLEVTLLGEALVGLEDLASPRIQVVVRLVDGRPARAQGLEAGPLPPRAAARARGRRRLRGGLEHLHDAGQEEAQQAALGFGGRPGHELQHLGRAELAVHPREDVGIGGRQLAVEVGVDGEADGPVELAQLRAHGRLVGQAAHRLQDQLLGGDHPVLRVLDALLGEDGFGRPASERRQERFPGERSRAPVPVAAPLDAELLEDPGQMAAELVLGIGKGQGCPRPRPGTRPRPGGRDGTRGRWARSSRWSRRRPVRAPR